MPDPHARRHGAWMLAIFLIATSSFLLAAFLVAQYAFGVVLAPIPTVTTALVVGGFFALIMIRPRRGETEFKVHSKGKR